MHQADLKSKLGIVPLTYASRDEAKVAKCLEHYLTWNPQLGRTCQYPISLKHDADFYLPEQNVILEYHPPVIKWYGGKDVYKRLMRLKDSLSERQFFEVQDLISTQISHEYFKRRRAIMDSNGHIQKRLIVISDFSELFQEVIKPFSRIPVKYDTFSNYIEKIKT